MQSAQELVELLTLEKIEDNLFRGNSYRTPWKRVFGGQVLAQSIQAAQATVPEDRFLHSMHAYFILPGDIERPIVYQVDLVRDGGSFTTRRVRAIQHGQDIFITAASFQLEQPGLDHQIDMPNVPPPEEVETDSKQAEVFKDLLPGLYKQMQLPRPIEFRPVESFVDLFSDPKEPRRHVWMKIKGNIADDKRLHHACLAYASDYNLLTTSILPHLGKVTLPDLQTASLDHAMWFHREFRMDEWLLYALDSPSASNSRGFNRGNLFNRDGKLVASVVQEGLVRMKRK